MSRSPRRPYAPELANHLVDTHFSERDREGRLLVFLARMAALLGRTEVLGAGLDEQAALVIERGGFEVLAAAGRSVWVYRVSGSATLQSGLPLDLSGIERVRLQSGAQGAWPLGWGAWPVTHLQVVAGVVSEQ